MKMLDSSGVSQTVLKWLKSNIKDFKDKDIRKWVEHLPHHTVKHLDVMMKHYKKSGGSFAKAHKLAMDEVGK